MSLAAGTVGANVLIVRGWELMSVSLFILGVVVLKRKRNPVFWGVFAGAILVCLFDWIWNRNWFGAVSYSDQFLPIWGARGEIEPVSLPLVYCFFFGLPMVMLLDDHAWLDERFGRRQWAVLCLLFAVPQMPFEILASKGLHLWTYHEVPPWTIAGVPWSNAVFSGLLGVGFYAAGRLALRWTWCEADSADAQSAGRVGVLTPSGPCTHDGEFSTRERWWRAFATTVALSALTLTVVTYAFLPWYLLVKPWAQVVPPL
jgi:hypothetical protein